MRENRGVGSGVTMDEKGGSSAAKRVVEKIVVNPFQRWVDHCMDENKTPSQSLVGRRCVAVIEDGDFRTLVFEPATKDGPQPRAFVIRLSDLTAAEVEEDAG